MASYAIDAIVQLTVLLVLAICYGASLVFTYQRKLRLAIWVSVPVWLVLITLVWSVLTGWTIRHARQEAFDEGRIESLFPEDAK